MSWAKLFRARLRRLFTVPKVAPRDVGNLGVALAFQLAQHEDGAVVCGQLLYALVHGLLEEALAVQVVWPGCGVFEL